MKSKPQKAGSTKSRTPMKLSRDGKMRRTRAVEIRFTEEEETILDLMYMEFTDGNEVQVTFSEFLAILLRQKINEERADLKAAMEANGLE